MPKPAADSELSRRERQIMDVLFTAGSATALEVQQRLPEAPSYSTVRTLLRILETKGYIRHKQESTRFIYEPAVAREAARQSALQRLLRTFFDGSAQQAVAALIDPKSFKLSAAELDELSQMIEKAKGGSGRKPGSGGRSK